jgi:NifU-like protein involved in Fe-S cluster formation
MVSKQLAEINARLAKVNQLVDELEAQSKREAVESKAVIAKTNALSQELKATHLANKALDQAFLQGEQQNVQFSDPDSSDYYFTGEGHFID